MAQPSEKKLLLDNQLISMAFSLSGVIHRQMAAYHMFCLYLLDAVENTVAMMHICFDWCAAGQLPRGKGQFLAAHSFNFNFNFFTSLSSAVSPSDNSRAFGLSPVWPLEAPSLKQANGDLRLGPHWRPQSPKSPKSPKVLRLSPQESR